ncbi:MAG: DUF3301 domain-containing protein [Rhodocyclaceae bacterium]|jgi:hypothetical protein|nr:DUF3301 domain-containing protein [Rhodocyclaceae bacterium]
MNTAELIGLLLLGGGVWFWLDSIRVRELGMRAARESCQREGVQLLDDTVSFRSLRPARDENGRACLRRAYDFEYSGSGNDRYRGSVMLLGSEVVMIDVSEHRQRVVIDL